MGRELKRRKIEEDFLLECLQHTLQDASVLFDVDLSRDWETINARVNQEGFGFISKTLPRFLDHIRSAISNNSFLNPSGDFKRYYSRATGLAPYPAFLRDLVTIVFDVDGAPRTVNPTTGEKIQEVLRAISLICQGFGKKYEFPLPKAAVKAQILETLRFDEEETFDAGDFNRLHMRDVDVIKRARFIIEDLHHLGNSEFDPLDFVPKHGSGSVTDEGILPHEKYRFICTPLSGLDSFPFQQYYSTPFICHSIPDPALPVDSGGSGRERNLDGHSWLVPGPIRTGNQLRVDFLTERSLERWARGGTSRLTTVPKDSKSVRVISMEEKELMFLQRGLMEHWYKWIEQHPVTSGRIKFSDQSINQRLALEGSRNGFWATLDLSRASDSVSVVHVWLLFGGLRLYDILMSLRSRYTEVTLPDTDGQGSRLITHRNKKYAPMGSALCFPVETTVFWALCTAFVQEYGSEVESLKGTYAYGDDLVVPARLAKRLMAFLNRLGFKVNNEKSFWSGLFRESCGVDAYDGVDVTAIVRAKKRAPVVGVGMSYSDFAVGIQAWLTYANRLTAAGYELCSAFILSYLSKQWKPFRGLPRLCEEVEVGFLYILDFRNGLTYEQYLAQFCSTEQDRAESYSYKPSYPERFTVAQGELFSYKPLPPFYQGRVKRLWAIKGQTYTPTDIDFPEEHRILRYYTEGNEHDTTSFDLRGAVSLVRSSFILT